MSAEMDGRVKRCACCGQTLPTPLALCVCGHPMNSHHPTPKGKGSYCTIWVHSEADAKGPMRQCVCTEEVRGG